MKPCSKNRKLIAWLAVDALAAEQATALRAHIAHCGGCRGYWEEMSNVTAGLAATKLDSNLEASASFHQRVAKKLQTVESSSALENLAAWLRGSLLNWRVAVPASAVLGIALFALVAPRHPSVDPLPAPPPVQAGSESSSGSDLAPTLANYQMIASQSLEQFDELLTRQGNKRLPPAPVYTASGLSL